MHCHWVWCNKCGVNCGWCMFHHSKSKHVQAGMTSLQGLIFRVENLRHLFIIAAPSNFWLCSIPDTYHVYCTHLYTQGEHLFYFYIFSNNRDTHFGVELIADNMSALFSFVGKKILAESARNHFGTEVNLPWHHFVCTEANRICLSRIPTSKKSPRRV